jgi:hypothetical protein
LKQKQKQKNQNNLMNNKILFLILLISSSLLAQKLPREIMNGQLVSDGMSVDDILITNKTAKTAAVSKEDGTFQLAVRVNDTLVFLGFNFPRQLLILSDADLRFNVLKIKLENQAANLDEVVISPNALSGSLKKDSENIKITQVKTGVNNQAVMARLYEDDVRSSPANKLMPGYLDDTYMVNFAKIGQKLLRSFKRSEAEKVRNKDVTRFSIVVQNRFSSDFFRNTLKVEAAELSSFLDFCESDPKANTLIESTNDFELINFLKQKKQEYMDLKKE